MEVIRKKKEKEVCNVQWVEFSVTTTATTKSFIKSWVGWELIFWEVRM